MATEQKPPPIDRKRLRSQRLREINFQGDALPLGMNWTEDDLGKLQILYVSRVCCLSPAEGRVGALHCYWVAGLAGTTLARVAFHVYESSEIRT